MVPLSVREYGAAAVGIGSIGVLNTVIGADPKCHAELGGRGSNLKPIEVAGDQSDNPRTQRLAWIDFHPEVDGELIGRVLAGRLGNLHVVIHAVERETLPDAARGKGGPILERAIIGTDRVQSVPLPAPPTRSEERRVGKECRSRW